MRTPAQYVGNPKLFHSPWGMPDIQRDYAEGIAFVGTPSHGGFWLSAARQAELDPRVAAATFGGLKGWFEEDCDWALVVATFPQFFDDKDVGAALESIKRNHPDLAGIFAIPARREIR